MGQYRPHKREQYQEYFYGDMFFVKVKGQTAYIDFTHITEERDTALKACALRFATVVTSLEPSPFQKALLANIRRYQTPGEMVVAANEYFMSCWGYKYDERTGREGTVWMQTTPYTSGGFCLALGIQRSALSYYSMKAQEGKIDPAFWAVVRTGLCIIEEYAERRLFDKNGAAGAEFQLKSSFGWQTPKEKAEIKKIIASTESIKTETELKKKMLEGVGSETDMKIEIVRKSDSLSDHNITTVKKSLKERGS